MNEFYKVLRSIRNEFGLSQKAFAAKIGMKPVAYNMIESGKNQPSFTLLNSLVTIFKVEPGRLFNDGLQGGLTDSTISYDETNFLNQAHEYIRKINYLYQRLIDIRVLLFQELKIQGQFSTKAEAALLNELARPQVKENETGTSLLYPYENLTEKQKEEYIQKLAACINLFTNTFFECFEQLYSGIRIPIRTKAASVKFLADRAKLTDEWKYIGFQKML